MQEFSLQDLLPSAAHLPQHKRMSLPEWIQRAQIHLRGRPYTTVGHEYLQKIIEDDHPDQTYEKGAQVGISTTVLIRSIYVAEHWGMKAIYFFQDDGAVSDFSNDRCATMIEESPYLKSRTRGTMNVGLKHIGPGSLFFRGLFTRGKAKSVDGDFVILDELDEANQDNKQFAMDRIMHSNLQWVCQLSQPSEPGFGIDAEFATTDQHFWHIICPACGHYNNLEENFLDPDKTNFRPVPTSKRRGASFPEGATHYRGCSKCEARLDMSKGEWVARQPNRHRRGYHLSQLYTQVNPPSYPNYASKIMAEYEFMRQSQSRLCRFVISVIGFPFAGGNVRITDDLLNDIEMEYAFSNEEAGAYMGVDQGDTLTIILGIMSKGRFMTVWGEETDKWGRLDELMDRFGVALCVIDAQPNKNSSKAFALRHRGRVRIQYFGSKELKETKERHEGKYDVDAIVVDRTESIDQMIDRMEMGRICLPSRAKMEGERLSRLEDIRRHLKQMIARTEADANGVPRKRYLRGANIENHYGMAMNNATLAAFDLGVTQGPMVMPVFAHMSGIGHA